MPLLVGGLHKPNTAASTSAVGFVLEIVVQKLDVNCQKLPAYYEINIAYKVVNAYEEIS